MVNKIDSNLTGLSFAEESSLKTLPGSPVWYALEPNSYSDFGGSISTVARETINPSRQRQKGTISDLEASGGFNSDITANNLVRLLQGFFFADVHEKVSTAPFNGTAITITGVTGSSKKYAAASGLDSFKANDLIFAQGFSNSANNGLDIVAASSATELTGTSTKTNETPATTANIQLVGHQFAAGDVTLAASSTSVSLACTAGDFSILGLNVGEWIFVGGDTAATQFANAAPFFGRVKTVSAKAIVFSETSGTQTTDTGATKTIRLFFGNFLRNEETATDIVRRSYQLERSLGQDDDGTQAEYLVGAVPNEFTITVPMSEKINCDMSFIGMDSEFVDGNTGVKTGTRVSSLGEEAFNTSTDIYRIKLSSNTDTFNSDALFAYVSDFSLKIANNVKVNKALGVLGGFDASAGNFDVSGSLTAFFTTTAALLAFSDNSDLSLNLICGQNNTGMIWDMPKLTISGGRVAVEKDSPITIPVESMACQNDWGYTLSYTQFPYLPTAAMPA